VIRLHHSKDTTRYSGIRAVSRLHGSTGLPRQLSRKLYVLDLQLWFHRRHRGLELGHANRPAWQRSRRLSTNSSTFGAESDGKSYDIIRRQRSSNGVLSTLLPFPSTLCSPASFFRNLRTTSLPLIRVVTCHRRFSKRTIAVPTRYGKILLVTELYARTRKDCTSHDHSGSATKKSRPDDHMPLIR
jgi:hypothetical protein